jgi:hypothetical protein
VGVDMTEEQVAKARRLAAESGFAQVEFRAGLHRESVRRGSRVRLSHLGRFAIETWRENDAYRFVSERAANATQKYGVTSISLLARRH